ncbi:alpha/beta fold hydrolase [Rhodococcus sp. NPDC006774]|uniref:alpha/beta hydrolase n=1 Tax=Rhodococcus sp. NPDC006774 TaxID=3157186 RepID=UPI0033E77E8A
MNSQTGGSIPDRIDVTFDSHGDVCAAWLYLPTGTGPAPVMVMAHGLGGTREMRLDAYAERFRAAGYACLVFDYRYFGASGGEPRQLLDIESQLQDWASAIDHARSRSDVDTSRIVLWGSSFGGGHVIVAAARDRKVAAVISQCPFTDGIASGLASNTWTSTKLSGRALGDLAGSVIGRPPLMVNTAGRPGTTALMTSPDSYDGYLALAPDADETFHNRVAARVALQIVRHRPGRRAKDVRCPILFIVCETDSVAPAKATLRYARTAPHGEIKTYDAGHFEIYLGEAFERVVGDQIEFLTRTVPPTQ